MSTVGTVPVVRISQPTGTPFVGGQTIALAGSATDAEDGTLPAGTRLPPVRRLAEALGLAANTVAKAYRELESAGVIETRGRLGSFVRAGDRGEELAVEAARRYAETVAGLGIPSARALELVAAQLRRSG